MAVKRKRAEEQEEDSRPGDLQIGYVQQLTDVPCKKRRNGFKFGFQKTKKGK